MQHGKVRDRRRAPCTARAMHFSRATGPITSSGTVHCEAISSAVGNPNDGSSLPVDHNGASFWLVAPHPAANSRFFPPSRRSGQRPSLHHPSSGRCAPCLEAQPGTAQSLVMESEEPCDAHAAAMSTTPADGHAREPLHSSVGPWDHVTAADLPGGQARRSGQGLICSARSGSVKERPSGGVRYMVKVSRAYGAVDALLADAEPRTPGVEEGPAASSCEDPEGVHARVGTWGSAEPLT